MQKSGFFNSVNGDRKYNANFFAEYFASFIGNGVFPNPSTNLQVLSANNGYNITIKSGKGWINGYYYCNTTDYNILLDVADGVLNRIDRIVLRFNTISRDITLQVKKGTFASSPVAPNLQRDADMYELGLADIYIKAGAINITQSDITDLRKNDSYCGIVHNLVQQEDKIEKATRTTYGNVMIGDNLNISNGILSADTKVFRGDVNSPLRTEVVSSLSSSASVGQIVFDNDTKKFKGFDGDKWL